jgi:hypothetical protein
MLSVDNRVTYIDDSVPVITTLHSVVRVKGIDDRVKLVDGKAVDDGVQYAVHQSPKVFNQ